MKTTNLICNACRKAVVVERDASMGPYGAVPSIEGWFHVTISELRKTPPRKSMADFMRQTANMVGIPEEKRDQAERMISSFAEMEQGVIPYGSSTPVTRSADICPECGPKVLGSVLPHVVGESTGYAVVGAGGAMFPTMPDDGSA